MNYPAQKFHIVFVQGKGGRLAAAARRALTSPRIGRLNTNRQCDNQWCQPADFVIRKSWTGTFARYITTVQYNTKRSTRHTPDRKKGLTGAEYWKERKTLDDPMQQLLYSALWN